MNEFLTSASTGLTYYAILFNQSGSIWNGSAFESPDSTHWATYVIAMTEADNSGIYSGNFPTAITTAGLYPYSVRQNTGVPVASDPDYANGFVNWNGSSVPTPGSYLISLSEYKAFYGITSTSTDDQINEIIPSVQAEIDNYLGFNTLTTAYSEVYNGTGNTFFRLKNKPISSLTSIILGYQTLTPVTFASSQFIFDATQAVIYPNPAATAPAPNYFPVGNQNIQVNYSAGWAPASVPQDIKRAAAMVIRRFLTFTINSLLNNSKTVGDVTIASGRNWLDLNDVMWADARRILDNYRTLRYIY